MQTQMERHIPVLKRWSVCASAFLVTLLCSAQPVLIPDTALRTWFNTVIPGCVDGDGYLDPGNPDVAGLHSASLTVDWSPCDLTGLDQLTGVQSFNLIFTVPGGEVDLQAFPPILRYLTIQGYPGSALPDLPLTLVSLTMVQAPDLINMPSLPEGLSTCSLVDLPQLLDYPVFPQSLYILDLQNLYLPAPGTLPDGLNFYSVDRLWNITALGALPPGVTDLRITSCPLFVQLPYGVHGSISLIDLPAVTDLSPLMAMTGQLGMKDLPGVAELTELPVGVTVLSLSMGQLTSIPTLPPQLTMLWVRYMGLITELPELPQTVTRLFLFIDSSLTGIPQLAEGFTQLEVDACPALMCLPLIPSTIEHIKLNGTGVTCFPVHFPAYTDVISNVDTANVCTILISDCPTTFSVFTGRVFLDQDGNGLHDPGEPPFLAGSVRVEPGDILLGLDSLGRFTYPIEPGTYSITFQPSTPYLSSISPSSHTIELPDTYSVDSLNDFAVVVPDTIHDLRISVGASWPVVGSQNHVWLFCQNLGGSTENAVVRLVHDAAQTLVGTIPPVSSISGDTLIWIFDSIPVSATRSAEVLLYTGISIPIGTAISHTAIVEMESDDLDPSNDVAGITSYVHGSYDPNDKVVTPQMIMVDDLASGQRVQYVIRFQNTGNYPAHRVLVVDTLPPGVDAGSLHLLGSSHPCQWFLRDGAVHFLFAPIALPDSISDEPGSHGMVSFSLLASAVLLPGDTVDNKADIYFDLNTAVITAPTSFWIEAPTILQELSTEGWRLFPNPASDAVVIDTDGHLHGSTWLRLVDLKGVVVKHHWVSSWPTRVSVRDLVPGTYAILTSDNSFIGSLVVIDQ